MTCTVRKSRTHLLYQSLLPTLLPPCRGIMNEDDLALCLGRFLHSCPGLSKVAIGELLGEPDAFYLKASGYGS